MNNRKLNILVVSDAIFEDEEGGAARIASEISNRLSERGHKIYNFSRRKTGFSKTEKIGKREIFRYKFKGLNLFGSYLDAKNIIENICRKTSIDILDFHNPQSAYLVNISGKLSTIPRIYHFQSPWHIEYEIRAKQKNVSYLSTKLQSAVRRKIENSVLKTCDKIIVLSEYMKDVLKNYHSIPSDRINIIPGSVDTERFCPIADSLLLRKELGLPSDKMIVFTVRNLAPRMGLENLLLAFSKVVEENKKVCLVIGGRGFLEEKLKSMSSELGLTEYVKFTGYIPDELLPKYYQASNLFVLPTLALEGFGLVTIESLSCGTPVLGTPIGATTEILLKLNLLFESNTPEAMAKRIKEFIELPQSELETLRKKCRDYAVENFSWERIIQKIEELFYSVTRKPSS